MRVHGNLGALLLVRTAARAACAVARSVQCVIPVAPRADSQRSLRVGWMMEGCGVVCLMPSLVVCYCVCVWS